jgi:hypothetical protein
MKFKSMLCRFLGHKEKRTTEQRMPLTYKTKSLDDGHIEQHNAYQLVMSVECSRCGNKLGRMVGFDGLIIPARSEANVSVSVEVQTGQVAQEAEWPEVIE